MSVFPLLSACRAHDTVKVQTLLRNRADPNEKNEKGSNGLIAAAMRGNTKICRLLVNAKAKVDHVNFNGDTPLSLSIWKSHPETGIFLISHARNSLDREDKFGDTPLLDACKGGLYSVVHELLLKNVDANHTNHKGESPLAIAKHHKHKEIIKILEQHGENRGKKSKVSGVRNSMMGKKNEQPAFPLLLAIRAAGRNTTNINAIRRLIKTDQVNKLDAKGISPLIAAAIRGETQVCQLLVAHGANVDYRSPNGDSALSLSIWKKHSETAVFLVSKARSTIDAYDKFGDTPLIDSVKGDLQKVAKELVARGADVNHKNMKNETPMTLSANNPAMLAVLGGDLRARRFSIRRDNQKDANPFPLLHAVRRGDHDQVKELLASGANPNKTNAKSISPLIAAAIRGQTTMCQLLIEKRANVDHVTLNDDSPLSLSIWKQKTETALFLAPKAFSTFDRSDKFGDTPLIDACKSHMLSVVRALLEKGADPNHKNLKGETAITICEHKNYEDILGELRREPESIGLMGPPGYEGGHCKVDLPPTYNDALYDNETQQLPPSVNAHTNPELYYSRSLNPSSKPISPQLQPVSHSHIIQPPSEPYRSIISNTMTTITTATNTTTTITMSTTIKVENMTTNDVVNWLEFLHFIDSAKFCRTERVDGVVFASLKPNDYADMHLPIEGFKRKQFEIKFKELQEKGYNRYSVPQTMSSPRTSSEFGTGMQGVTAWLASLGLEKYASRFQEEEYNNLDFILQLDANKLDILIQAVRMKSGSAERLRKHFHN